MQKSLPQALASIPAKTAQDVRYKKMFLFRTSEKGARGISKSNEKGPCDSTDLFLALNIRR